ncbi:neurexin-1b-like [Dysidea avara]|uniref:neurexin-1b-like n=1 Tax=Dysidea avara TaxID=196820 RepID=UPI003327CE11
MTGVYVGGVPAEVIVPLNHVRSRDYVGCMRDLIINGNHIELSDKIQNNRCMKSHNVVDGCAVGSRMEKCDTCENETCVNFVVDEKPYCDCEVVGASCLLAPSTLVSFTGKNRRADLIIKPKEDFYLALQQSRQTRQAVEQVTFEFRTATIEAVVLSSRTEDGSGNLGVFWFDNSSVHYYAYQNGSLCNRVTVEGHFNDDNWHSVEVTIEGDNIKLVMDYNTSHTSSNTSRCQDVFCASFNKDHCWRCVKTS